MACPLGKPTWLPLAFSNNFLIGPLDLIFVDVWGPAPNSVNGKK